VPAKTRHPIIEMNTPETDRNGVSKEQERADPLPPRQAEVAPAKGYRRLLLVGGAVLLIALLVGFLPRFFQRQAATADTNQLAISTVAVVSPTLGTPPAGLTIPAEVKPWLESSIFARANGFLKSWLVDIGAHVEAGQLLAEIDTPDLNQQLDQARAQLVLAQANRELAKTTNDSWQQMFKQNVVSDLDAQTKAAALAVAVATVDANQATVRQLEALQDFQRVIAPFAGTITIRNVDVGDLINTSVGGKELFHIAQTQSLRVYFRVPQTEAPNIAVGQTLDVLVGTQGGPTYPGKVITTSEAVSPLSRTLLVELEVDNSKNQILPGSYATVSLSQSALGKILTLPDNALIFRAQGLQVGVVDAKGVVQVRDVKVGRDFGTTSEILGGVTESDKVIINPSDSLASGTIVRVADTPNPVGNKSTPNAAEKKSTPSPAEKKSTPNPPEKK
jgi:membrane fusion protein (multidrug efflux system)